MFSCFCEKNKSDNDVDSMNGECTSCFSRFFGAKEKKKYYEPALSVDNFMGSKNLEQPKREQVGYGDIYGARRSENYAGTLNTRSSDFLSDDSSSDEGNGQAKGAKNNACELASGLQRTKRQWSNLGSDSTSASGYPEKPEHKRAEFYIGCVSDDKEKKQMDCQLS